MPATFNTFLKDDLINMATLRNMYVCIIIAKPIRVIPLNIKGNEIKPLKNTGSMLKECVRFFFN